MPVYDFECTVCGKQLELTQSFGESAPLCFHGKENETQTAMTYSSMVKKISKTSFQLKGNGWYRDGYKGK